MLFREDSLVRKQSPKANKVLMHVSFVHLYAILRDRSSRADSDCDGQVKEIFEELSMPTLITPPEKDTSEDQSYCASGTPLIGFQLSFLRVAELSRSSTNICGYPYILEIGIMHIQRLLSKDDLFFHG